MEDYNNDVFCYFYVANNESLSTKGASNVKVKLSKYGIHCTIVDVKYAPQAATNLLSIARIAVKNYILVFITKVFRFSTPMKLRFEAKRNWLMLKSTEFIKSKESSAPSS